MGYLTRLDAREPKREPMIKVRSRAPAGGLTESQETVLVARLYHPKMPIANLPACAHIDKGESRPLMKMSYDITFGNDVGAHRVSPLLIRFHDPSSGGGDHKVVVVPRVADHRLTGIGCRRIGL